MPRFRQRRRKVWVLRQSQAQERSTGPQQLLFWTRRRTRVVLATVGGVLVIAGCGTPPSVGATPQGERDVSAPQPWDHLTGAAREKALLEAAQKEGTLSVYSSYNDEQSMAKAFTQKYGIQVEVYNANSETVLQRVMQEWNAKKQLNDVLISPATDMQAAQNEGVLGNYTSEYRDAISAKGKGDQWTGLRRLAFVAGWNTKSMQPAEIPQEYTNFAEPSWKGRISMEISDVDWYASLRDYYLAKGMSQQDVQKMFQAIASNSKIVKGHTVQGELMAAGQFDVALSVYTQTIDRLVGKNAPVSYGGDNGHIVAPVVVRYDAGGVMKNTDNPAGAALYFDFELSKDGFAVDKQLGALPPIPQPGEPLTKAETIELDVPAFVKNRTQLENDYEHLLPSGTKAG
jgi:iron(III) transport system substrate-binding protein